MNIPHVYINKSMDTSYPFNPFFYGPPNVPSYLLNLPLTQLGQELKSRNRVGHWTEKENAKYYSFLKIFNDKFNEKQSRRQWKVFKALATFIKSRNANQCRSHHHKMQKNFKTTEQTLKYLLKKNPLLEEKSIKYYQQLKEIKSQFFNQNYEKKEEYDQSNHQNADPNIIFHTKAYNEGERYIYHSFNFGKPEIAYLKTSVDYDIQQNLKFYQPPQSKSDPQLHHYFLYPAQQEPPQNIVFSSHLSYDANKEAYPSMLMQCHQTFNKWLNKISRLIKDQEELNQAFPY